MATVYSPQENTTDVEEKIIAMSPTVEKGTYVKTHSHVIYSSRLFVREQQHHKAAKYQLRHTVERRLIVLESVTYLPQSYVPPQAQLSKGETANTKSIRGLLHNAEDLLMYTNGELTPLPFTRV